MHGLGTGITGKHRRLGEVFIIPGNLLEITLLSSVETVRIVGIPTDFWEVRQLATMRKGR